MVLSFEQEQELKIGGYINYSSSTLGLDSLRHCFSKNYYKNFEYDVTYNFNFLGYRERSINQYTTSPILVLGDSFTLGLGLPCNLTYASQLETLCQTQVLNFSLNGASNDWISRKLAIILKYFSPKAIIVHYSFSQRRELNNNAWFDDERTLCETHHSDDNNYTNWLENHNKIKQLVGTTPTVYSFIPNWHTTKINFTDQLVEVEQIDYARDYFHYGPKTCAKLAHLYADRIALL
jgi:hypothetical protein